MMIAYPAADICCELKEDKIQTIIIESQHMFYSIISDIQAQLEGNSGDFVLSENYIPLDMQKSAELISQFIPFTVNQKELINKLYNLIKRKAVNENMYLETREIILKISDYLYKLTEDEEYELTISVPEDISGILKAFNFRFDDAELTLSEKLLEYMISSNELKAKKLFITVNLRSFLTNSQTEKLFESVLLKKLKLLCIESAEHERIKNERVIIIDKDMCVI